jgi:signal transduction histidine kinase
MTGFHDPEAGRPRAADAGAVPSADAAGHQHAIPRPHADPHNRPLTVVAGGALARGPEGPPGDLRAPGTRPPAPLAPERIRAVAEARARFLADASRALATSIEVGPTVGTAARVAVPALADYALVHLLQPDGRLQLAATAHADAGRGAVLEAHRVRASAFAPAGAVSVVLDTRRAALVREVAGAEVDAYLNAYLAGAGGRADARPRDLAPRSLILAPLVARGRLLGVLTLATAESGRSYTHDDLEVAEEVAGRAALAIDNARMCAEITRASKAKSDLLAAVSHELRTPLQVVLGYADLIRSGSVALVARTVRDQAERIHGSASHMLELVEQLQRASRADLVGETVRAEPVDAGALAREMVLLVEPLAAAKGLRVGVQAPASPVTLVTGRRQLRQILYNLLANAVKFTDRGFVTLAVGQRDAARPGAPGPVAAVANGVVFEVRDTGVGIAPEHMARIFDSFWRAEQATAAPTMELPWRAAGGMGLGLSIARRLARLLGGDLSARSASGRGSTFTVALPLAYSGQADAAGHPFDREHIGTDVRDPRTDGTVVRGA